jgi:hypothetical protein
LNPNKLLVDDANYDLIKGVQFDNKSMVREHIFGTRVKLISDGLMIATKSNHTGLEKGNLSDGQFSAFIANFNKQLYRQFKAKPELFDLEVSWKGMARQKNMKAWKSMNVNDYFYNVDLNSAYWQIAYKLGYIEDKMYKKYLDADDYKQVKRYVISFLARKNYVKYYVDKDKYWEICCDSYFLKNVYTNVRFELYNHIAKCIKGVSNWLEYNIDGIFVKAGEIETVLDYFRAENLKFKIVECRKINDNQYLYKGLPRIFKHKITYKHHE